MGMGLSFRRQLEPFAAAPLSNIRRVPSPKHRLRRLRPPIVQYPRSTTSRRTILTMKRMGESADDPYDAVGDLKSPIAEDTPVLRAAPLGRILDLMTIETNDDAVPDVSCTPRSLPGGPPEHPCGRGKGTTSDAKARSAKARALTTNVADADVLSAPDGASETDATSAQSGQDLEPLLLHYRSAFCGRPCLACSSA